MANFPNSPATDEVFHSRDGSAWIWNGNSWKANLTFAQPNEIYVNYKNDSNTSQYIADKDIIEYSDSTEMVLEFTVTRGYANSLIELEGCFQSYTDTTVAPYLELQRKIGSGIWIPVQNVLVGGVESNGTAFQQIFKPQSVRILDDHGADIGETVSYRFINNTADVTGGGSNIIQMFYQDVATTFSVKELK